MDDLKLLRLLRSESEVVRSHAAYRGAYRIEQLEAELSRVKSVLRRSRSVFRDDSKSDREWCVDYEAIFVSTTGER